MSAPATWPLRYVCVECGAEVATFPEVRSHEPATVGLCDRPECVAAAGARWRGETPAKGAGDA